ANQMVASHLHTVRTLHVDEADVTELVRLRERLKPRAEARGVRLSYLPLIMKAVAQVLPAFPSLASAFDAVTQEIVLRDYVNLGMAVSTELGLVVPVVRDVDRKALIDVAEELQGLATKARDGRLAPDDVRGGTFSITNIGSVGGLFSFPIINVPEAAILGVHAIRKRPVVLADDAIAVRPMLYLSLSFDHRLVDGADAARFTNQLIDLLEAPEAVLLDA
ncbi:MAG: 2-oxo acid dehydrogenase subunit E2, partial [bacterium]|nr:2-oxo acid dehydrogenase subunit E2 [bacterium]